MSRLLASFAAAALLAAPALAVGYGFTADYADQSVPTIGTIDVVVNPELIREARAIPRGNPRDGEYIDPRDADDLIADLREELEGELSRSGAYAPMTAGPVGTLVVTIERATSSNPAHTKAGQARNLDFRSAGRGGATLVAELLGPDGSKVADYSYRWEESSFDVASSPRIGWLGAERAFDRFSARLAREFE